MSAEDMKCPICGDRLYFTGGIVRGLAQGPAYIGPSTVECVRGHYRGVHIERPQPPEHLCRLLDDSDAEPDRRRAGLYALGVVLVILAVAVVSLTGHTGCAP